MAIYMKKMQTYKNIAMNVVAFAVQFLINLYISPKIVSDVGTAAYGFIGLANDFVSYATILATIFNSVASRFIANSYYKKEYDRANCYFNSLIVTNFILAGFLGAGGIIFVANLEYLFSVPSTLIFDVKLTFVLIFSAYILTLITNVFTTSTFVSNRTDIKGIRNIIDYVVRFFCIIVFLNFVSIHIYWIALSTLIATTIVAIMNVNLTKKLTPELKINFSFAKKKYSFELAKAGCWMAITNISSILLRGLDLTVANIMIGDYEMGLLSVARTMPNSITSIIATIAPIFTPIFLSEYSKGNIKGIVDNVKKTIDTMALILFVPISGFIVFAYDFYSLWQKSLTPEELKVVTGLSILTVIQAYFNSTTATMAQLSVVVNKLKVPVLISFVCGIVSIVTEIIMIKFSGLGLYAIVLSTTVVMIIRYVIFNSFYAAWCLNQPKTCFFPSTLKTWVSIPVLIVLMIVVRTILPIHSWMGLYRDAIIAGGIGYILMLLVYGKSELKMIIFKLKNK